jgi:hypothetical protein
LGQQFDDLSKAMARRVSRAQALRGVLGGAIATALALIFPGKVMAGAMGSNSACAQFCAFVYGAGSDEALMCASQAAHANANGPCYLYGPASPACQAKAYPCPSGSFCTSINANGSLEQATCVQFA